MTIKQRKQYHCVHRLVYKAEERIQCLPGNSGLLDNNSARMQPTDQTSTDWQISVKNDTQYGNNILADSHNSKLTEIKTRLESIGNLKFLPKMVLSSGKHKHNND